MANPLRSRKRVFADFRRAPDGSAFQKCAGCGVSLAVALADMHVCEVKIKKAKPQFQETRICQTYKLEQQPRSAFLFFRENFAKTCEGENIVDIDRRACIVWKNMSWKERMPYTQQSDRVDAAYTKALLQESSKIEQDDDEADSKNCFRVSPLSPSFIINTSTNIYIHLETFICTSHSLSSLAAAAL